MPRRSIGLPLRSAGEGQSYLRSMSTLRVRQTCRFRRAPDVVRCHFLDIQHHVAHDVHKGVRYTILSEDRARLRITSDFHVLGMKKHDEIVLYATADGRVI